VEDKVQEAQVPEIWETEEEKALSDKELKAHCFNFAHQRFQGKVFNNKSIQKAVAVSRDGIGEWKTVSKSRDQILSIKILNGLLENGMLWKEEPPKNRDLSIEKVIYLRQRCRVNGTEYRAIITVKVYKAQDYHKYYHHYLDDVALDPVK
jgi:hypothetical protein